MKPSKLYEALDALIGERVPLHIWGPCGVGKSEIVGQVAGDLDYEFLDVRAVQLDPVDLRGLPRIAPIRPSGTRPNSCPHLAKASAFSMSDLGAADDQAGCYQLVLDRRLGEYGLPDGRVVMAAGNPASGRGVHFAMPRPLRNRFVHLDLSRTSTTGANGRSGLTFGRRSSPFFASSRNCLIQAMSPPMPTHGRHRGPGRWHPAS